MPSVSGGALRPDSAVLTGSDQPFDKCFYALGVGRGFATWDMDRVVVHDEFLCPRCRAGLCDCGRYCMGRLGLGFYALGVGRGFATDAFLVVS
jgi:hypothetical protein